MPGNIHRLGDSNTSHWCPPYWPSGFGFPSVAITACNTVLANGIAVVVAGCITMWHPCTDWDDWCWHPGIYIMQRNVLAEGSPVQATNDLNSCNAVLCTGSPNVLVGD